MTNSLVIYDQFDQLARAADALQKSGYFKDVTSQAQAIVKVMAGAELGLPPFASMSGIHIIQGKPVLGANVLATLVKNDPRYDYHVITDPADQEKEMFLEWFEGGKRIGVAGFTMAEAKDAGLSNKDNWKKYPSDMLFARAISRGARRFAPGIFGGSPVYTPDEMGADVDEDGNVVAVEATEILPAPQDDPRPASSNGNERPLSPDKLHSAIEKKSHIHAGKVVEQRRRQVLASQLDTIFDGDKTKRYELCKWLAGEASTKKIPDAFVQAMLDWLNVDDYDQVPNAYSIDEARTALTEALKASGQAELL